MTKLDTIEAIRRYNRSADSVFLSQFSIDDLTRYLTRLNSLPADHLVDAAAKFVDVATLPPGTPEIVGSVV